ncbi:MAG: hypothetical protein OXT71_03005 [Acidobacteriota bacterium]|nr:hypothetical protein [Acidobacteriota bacterium]
MPQSPPPKPLKPHPGIRIEKIPVRGAAGLIFVFGVMFIFWAGVPPVRGFLILGVVGGLAAFAGLRWWRHRNQGHTGRRLFTETKISATAAGQPGRAAPSPKQD